MRPRRRRLSGTVPGDAGVISLAELAVSMVVSAGLAVLITSLVIVTFRQSRDGLSRVPLQGSAQQAVDAMARAARTTITPAGQSQALTLATPTAMTFFAQLNRADSLVVDGLTVPSKVELYASGECLWRAITPARLVASGSPLYAWDTGRSALCLARTAVLPTTTFSYFASPTDSSALTGGAGLSSADRDQVRSVQISLILRDARTGVPSRTVDTRVTLVNRLAEDSG